MKTSLFDYNLPEGLIADAPVEPRDAARLMCVYRKSGQIMHRMFKDLPDQLQKDDLLVVNNSRVFCARLYGKRKSTGGKVEALLIKRVDENLWWAFVKPGRRVSLGDCLVFGKGKLEAEVVRFGGKGERLLRFDVEPGRVESLIDEIGVAPLPPYILKERRRLAMELGEQTTAEGLEREEDKALYQTVYAGPRGSVAAPTAGLHFTQSLIRELEQRGHPIVEVTLHVGPGTFKPMTTETIEEHPMHSEEYSISADSAREINKAKREGRRIVAVGTTSVRVLESVARASQADNPQIRPGSGVTSLMISPGYNYRMVDAMITNFHLPRSTLLMLVSAFAGHAQTMVAYKEAIANNYRFYSYGDAMFIQ